MARPGLRKVLSFLGVALAIAVPVVIFVMGAEKRELSFGTIAVSKLIDVDAVTIDSLEIIYKGDTLSTLSSVLARIENSGTVPIRRTDFERNMIITFPPPAKLIAAGVTECYPPNLSPKIKPANRTISIEPLLLNPKDHFLVVAYVTNYSGRPEIDVRIAGIHRPTILAPGPKGSLRRAALSGIPALICFVLYCYYWGLLVTLWLSSGVALVRKTDLVVLVMALAVAGAVLISVALENLAVRRSDRLVSAVAVVVVLSLPSFWLAVRRGRRLLSRTKPEHKPAGHEPQSTESGSGPISD